MKKIISLMVVIVLIGGLYVIMNRDKEINQDSLIEQKLPLELTQSKKQEEASSKEKVRSTSTKKKKTQSAIEKELFLWRGQMKQFFAKVLPQDETALMDYTELKDGFEEDRLDAYDRFMEEASNNNEEFNITDLEDGEYQKIQLEYFNAFEKRFGRDVFNKYLKTMQNYNDKILDGNDQSLKVNF